MDLTRRRSKLRVSVHNPRRILTQLRTRYHLFCAIHASQPRLFCQHLRYHQVVSTCTYCTSTNPLLDSFKLNSSLFAMSFSEKLGRALTDILTSRGGGGEAFLPCILSCETKPSSELTSMHFSDVIQRYKIKTHPSETCLYLHYYRGLVRRSNKWPAIGFLFFDFESGSL